MNYLAHIYLSHDSIEATAGSLLGDFVKGTDFSAYSPAVQKAIRLHRQIDTFTDQHPVVRQSKLRIQASRRRYAGILVDLFYDHYLAKHWHINHQKPLTQFTKEIYEMLLNSDIQYPDRMTTVLHYMSRDDWLSSYREIESIERALQGLSRRLIRSNPLANCITELTENYAALEHDFLAFFPDLCEFARLRKGD